MEDIFFYVIHASSPLSVLPRKRSESKWLRLTHPISALLLFNMFQSLLALEGSLQSGEQDFKARKRCLGWQTGCLSVYHPTLSRGHAVPGSGTKGDSLCSQVLLGFCKMRLVVKKTIAVTPKCNWCIRQSGGYNGPL